MINDYSVVLLWNCCGSVGLPGKRLGLQFVLIYFVATSHITSSTIPNWFSVNTQYCPCPWHRGRYIQFFERFITNTWGLGSLQNRENEANLLLPSGIQKLKGFQLQGGDSPPPQPPDQGLCPWTPLGAPSPDPRYRLALRARHVCPPHTGASPGQNVGSLSLSGL